MTNGDRFNQGVADRIDEILQVAAVARGDAVHVAAS
jgi:hypothetical protein